MSEPGFFFHSGIPNIISEQRGISRAVAVSFQIIVLCLFFPPERQASPLREPPLPACFRSDLRQPVDRYLPVLSSSRVTSAPSVHPFLQGAHTTTAFQSFFTKTHNIYSFRNTSIPIWISTACPIRLTSNTAYFLWRSIRLTLPS